ncbi:hotdog fold thioesterase [Thioalkalivibrio sp. XN8]|uniref:hotdog fold thioesterase n=1 Tax=Thioalkalivibrio sp. XN8 TaxID=2712863 RepID=UPI0013EDF3E1|nr:hotdog fold thioesterase [Thioalkalivibrio sp. XN8]NGP52545.1 hotdog fold thioesterase [Thioalkalivibrio sp. XN8]
MSIWHRKPTVEALNAMSRGTLMEQVDIRFTEVGDDYLAGTMPVDGRTHQPFGLLHGGATAALAETLGSSAANCCLDMSTHYAVGLEINTNHLRSVRSGLVTGTARPIHIGRRTQVWEIRTTDESGRLTAISRLTMAVMPREEG